MKASGILESFVLSVMSSLKITSRTNTNDAVIIKILLLTEVIQFVRNAGKLLAIKS